MPGFRISNLNIDCELRNVEESRCKKEQILFSEWYIKRNTLNKFMNDKIFFENDSYIVLLEGILLNTDYLSSNESEDKFRRDICQRLDCDGIDFIKKIKGNMSGVIFMKNDNKVYVFTNRLGDKAVFYFCKDGKFAAGSQLNYISDILRVNSYNRTLNEYALRQFMAYGFYLDESTCIKEVNRLFPGHYLEFNLESGELKTEKYWIADNKQDLSLSEEDLIDKYEEVFSNAMRLIAEKNQQYGYVPILDISGGADSRMICFNAKKIGIKEAIMDCYAQTGSNDERIAIEIANYLGYDSVFRPLDTANCMMNIDENIIMNNGATIYYGITGGKSMLQMLDRNTFGIEYTGLLGDVFDGSMVVDRCDGNVDKDYKRYRYSTILEYGKDFEVQDGIDSLFKNHINEHYWFYVRGMIFGMSSFFIRQNYTEAMTPFGSPEFIDLYFRTDWNTRVYGKLLRKWMIKKYPQAARYDYGDSGENIYEGMNDSYLNEYKRKIRYKIKNFKYRRKANGMNDIQYWYNNNDVFKNYVNNYFKKNLDITDINMDIKMLIKKLFKSELVSDKLLAVSVISIIKNYVI